MYTETALILDTTITFSFHDGQPFQQFLPLLFPAQQRSILFIRFEIGLDNNPHCGYCTPRGNEALKLSVAKSLTGLRRPHIDLLMAWTKKEEYHDWLHHNFFEKDPFSRIDEIVLGEDMACMRHVQNEVFWPFYQEF